MKLLAFAASNSSKSINRALVEVALERLRWGEAPVEATTLDINDYEMPIYSSDREEANGTPQLAQDLLKLIGEADAILISFAEHNGYVTAAWKNIFDWMSRAEPKVWQGKPLLFLATSPGARGGASVLESQIRSAPFFDGQLVASLAIGRWTEAYDPDSGTLTRAEDVTALDEALDALVQTSVRSG